MARCPGPQITFEKTALFWHAAYIEDVDAVEKFIQQDGIDPNVANVDGLTALHTVSRSLLPCPLPATGPGASLPRRATELH